MYKLKNMYKDNLIKIKVNLENPEDIIRLGGNLLLEKNIITNDYIDAMIDAYKELGSYIVIAPNIAMPHASAENGALKTGASLIILDKPVNFGNEYNDPVYFIFCIANSGGHEELLSILESIVEIGSSEEIKEILKGAKTKEEIKNIMDEFNL